MPYYKIYDKNYYKLIWLVKFCTKILIKAKIWIVTYRNNILFALHSSLFCWKRHPWTIKTRYSTSEMRLKSVLFVFLNKWSFTKWVRNLHNWSKTLGKKLKINELLKINSFRIHLFSTFRFHDLLVAIVFRILCTRQIRKEISIKLDVYICFSNFNFYESDITWLQSICFILHNIIEIK